MPKLQKKIAPSSYNYLTKEQALGKINKSTKSAMDSNILKILKKKGIEEITIEELQIRLSKIKKPLSEEIISERNNL